MNVIPLDLFEKYLSMLDTATKEKVEIAINANSFKELTSVRKMQNSIFYRKRIGNYRLIFEWDKKSQEICLYKVGLRKDIYKKK
jgi:mRNA-degrading endonuclease RelE of RelBE toxin-antitoxin system